MRRSVVNVAVIVIAAAALLTVDRWLAALEIRELQAEARHDYAAGLRLLAANDPAAAAKRMQRAHSLQRKNRDYSAGYARALFESGRIDDAAVQLRQLLADWPNDGEANLFMARVHARRGNVADADAFYHRAIYGTWRSNPDGNRLRTRVETAEYLAGKRDPNGLLAELLVLEDQARANPELGSTVARLLLAAGSARRAADAYRQLLRADRHDPVLLDGLGRSQLAMGDYRGATLSFLELVRRDPDFPAAAENARLSSTLARLDPTPRGLGPAELRRRAASLLEQIIAAAGPCAGIDPNLLESSRTLLTPQRKRRPDHERAEELLTAAGQLWASFERACTPAARENRPLAMIMDKLSQ